MKLTKQLAIATLFLGASAQAATISLIATEDTHTRQNASSTNSSTSTTFGFGAAGGGQAQSMLFRFDTSTLASIPAADILSVTLNLTLQDSTGIRSGFVGTLVDGNADWTNTGATWATRNGTDSWAGADGARSGTDSEILNSAFALTADDAFNDTTIAIPLSVGGAASYADFAALFAEWNDGSNNGMVIYNSDVGTASGTQTFYSSEAATASFRPELVIVTVPEPSSAALLGLGGLALILRRRKS